MKFNYAKVRSSVSVYPVTTMYLAGVAVTVAIAAGLFRSDIGVLTLTVIAFMILMTSLNREVKIVHFLVNSQRDVLLSRISDLVDALEEAGIELPKREQDEERKKNGDH